MKKLFIVNAVDPCGYDSWPIGYHLTRKGALRHIMQCKYNQWNALRYITPGGYDDDAYYITEGVLEE